MTEGKILELIIKDKKFKINQLADMLGIARGTIYNHFKEDVLSPDIKQRYETAMNIDWDVEIKKYVSGKHEQKLDTRKEVSKPRLEADVISLAPDPYDQENREKIFELADGSLAMNVRVVPAKAQAGYLLGFQDPEYFEDMDVIPVNVLKRHAGDYLAFEVRGDSMTSYDPQFARRSIYEGQIAIGRELSKQHWKSKLHIHSNDAWIIVHKSEGILIKEIVKHDVEKGIITVHSLNPDFKDKDYFLGDIEQIFDVLQVVDKRR